MLRRRSTFWLLAAALWTGLILLRVWFPLAPRHRVYPLADIYLFTPSLFEGLLYALLFGVLAMLCWLASRLVERVSIPPWQIWLAALLFCLPLLDTFPINATDVYRYYIRARVGVVHGGNPFADPPSSYPEDGYTVLAGEWADFTSPYGPLWELGAAGVARAAGDNLLLALRGFKGLGALSFLLSGWLLWWGLAGEPAGVRRGRLLLWLWNPALLLTFVVNAHNDGLMIFWLLAGWLLMQRGRLLSGWLVAVLAPLTKPIAVLALPYLLIHAWRRWAPQAGLWAWRPRLGLILGAPAGGLLLLLATFAPFGNPLDLANRLLAEAQGGSSFAPVTLLLLAARRVGWQLDFGWLGGAGLLALVLLALWAAWRTLHGRPAVAAAADLFAGYVLQAFNFRIWYATWPWPWLLLDTRPAGELRLRAGLLFLFGAQLSVVVYAHVRRLLLDGDHFWSHVHGVGLVFLLPLALLIWGRLRVRGRSESGPGRARR